MTKRPWVPIAAVLVVLLVGTLIAGSVLRGRLADAAAVLDPIVDSVELANPELTPLCAEVEPDVGGQDRAGHDIAGQVGGFLDAVAADDLADELSTTRATFDSFLLQTAVARAGAGPHQLVLRAEREDGAWCLAEAEFTTDE